MTTCLFPPSVPAYGQHGPEGCMRPRAAEWPQRATAYAPASIGNFAAGFDFLGAALAPVDGSPFGNRVEARRAEALSLTVEGPHGAALEGKPNLVLAAAEAYREALEQRGLLWLPAALTLHMELPPASGLGSSASSIVATLVALQELHGGPLSPRDLLVLAGRVEGAHGGGLHLDNVAPCYLGGLRLVLEPSEHKGPETRALPWPEDLWIVVAHPALEVPTALARQALPQALELPAAVQFSRNAAGLVHAIHEGDLDDIARTLWDPVAEPHRARFVPGFDGAKAAALAAGALGCSLSGSGPSLFAAAPSYLAPAVAVALRKALEAAGHTVDTRVCTLDRRGARIQPC